ncbi:bifunctional DNA-formamidopyrimidine glycosylase/DNA-(apurinic or apyrimidinic site) lyase [Corynebacterium sp. sy017]|uniref:bifunctional DNA-formamidopyrimidine glycosylase/DNA-(apurinic or apyrimidinic site) lyase n=1 Tax=unclassified Corynebacterium TaxID=2624378 RepID=UPI0011865131|nr:MULTISPECIES: bifunctional DNA-formamidopyrimidine glycosylase/DNA-(apurinic or apyrimidinic site) lyase [unclassified Corynebacterium]MBP3087884.1 bifunctional DNA-formamidopyrimidine glycosylase/DNA-(apurinic or apyrimidinic site) lyase [Corynebacterium sp. sy017]TSD92425.1 bifunctional DNA-formamidopyrimidine glycosylase/DNA-(apurinic or apyrimidinic site) lyase [Corynebacterium sp. SY003]
MPELPEVEVVRRGLETHILGCTITDVLSYHHRTLRKYPGTANALQAQLRGRRIDEIARRGKFLWLCLDDDQTIVIHLGMSGQLLIKDSAAVTARYGRELQPHSAGLEDKTLRHLRLRVMLDNDIQVWFVDQRTFGYFVPDELVPGQQQKLVPELVSHIAPDLLEEDIDFSVVAAQIRAKKTEIKRVLLNQEIVSGIGNIYADEMLWAASVHPATLASSLTHTEVLSLLSAGKTVMTQALAQGGTSFDELYVNVNGESGYFERSLHAYGQHNKPCARCGTKLVKQQWMNRSSHYCPQCQVKKD